MVNHDQKIKCLCQRWGFSGWKVEKTRFGIRFSCPYCGRLYGYLTQAEYDAKQKKRPLLKEKPCNSQETKIF